MSTYYMRAPGGEVFATENPEYHKDCENLGRGEKGKTARRDYARECLRGMIDPGAKVYCVLRSVGRSGMSRDISLFIAKDGDMRNIDQLAADATGHRTGKNSGVYMSGCGMDMGFALVYSLGRALWPNGTDKPHGSRNGEPDSDGGYALKYEWL